MSFPPIVEASPDFFIADEKNNLIGVKTYRNGQPCAVPGDIRIDVILPDRRMYQMTTDMPDRDGNRISYGPLFDYVYRQNGRIQFTIKIENNGDEMTLGVIRGTVYPTRI